MVDLAEHSSMMSLAVSGRPSVVFLVLLLGFSTEVKESEGSKMGIETFTQQLSKFSSKFCNELEQDKSVVASPLSVNYVLGLIALGTTDPAHAELLESLGLLNDDDIRCAFTQTTQKLKESKGITLEIANKVYVKTGAQLSSELKEDAVKVFDAELESLNFAESSASANTINAWVENKTHNKIKKLISEDDLDADTRVVLINALYFKGTWAKQFNPRFTQNLPFNINAHTKVDIPMMFKKDSFNYGKSQELNAKLIELNYEGDNASMLIILPNEIEGLKQLMQKLASGFDINKAVAEMHSVEVELTLPRFKIESEIDLNKLLPKLGIKTIFNKSNSGLTKILEGDEQLFVSKAIQKAFIEVNEEGSEAAAATGVVMMLRCAMMGPEPITFVADRPYLAILYANAKPLFYASFRGDNSE